MRLRRLGPASLLAALIALSSRPASAEGLTAEEALARAAAQNLTLKAAILDARAAESGVEAEDGARDPVFTASVTGSYTESTGGATGSAALPSTKALATKAALRYTTDIGTQLEIGSSADASWATNQAASLRNEPTYSALAYVSARQPLLRGAGADAQLAARDQAVAAATAAELTEQATASDTARAVLAAYWELWYAEQALGVQESALATATKQLSDARVRQSELGTASKADVLQFESNVASIKDSLAQAETQRAARALELGRLLGMEPATAYALEAHDDLPTSGRVASASTLAARAEEASPELAALRANLDATRIRVAAAEDTDQPRLDLVLTGSAGMLWADRDDVGIGLAGGRPAFSVIGGIELELPVGGGRYAGDAARARTQLSAAETRYQERELAIATQVGNLQQTARAAESQVALAAESARIAAELAEAERQRLVLGTTTSAEVVRAEQTSREAELRSLRTRVDAIKTNDELLHVTGSLLPRYRAVFSTRAS